MTDRSPDGLLEDILRTARRIIVFDKQITADVEDADEYAYAMRCDAPVLAAMVVALDEKIREEKTLPRPWSKG